ncbi:MAG TPA: AbrB/MazE/SpoVT family DNA-binding domain-containing protein [Candidatus Nanoarchaeia archaeon]|nr:AbrB/MazE/SpoVT family DNA-binding domain-containing protein [Candidatus Nanoarchaeia archaeon]
MQEEIKDIRTAKITSKGQISIPLAVRTKAGFREGTKVSVIAYKDRVELRLMKKEEISNAMICMLASEQVLAKNWLSKEDEEAWKDL